MGKSNHKNQIFISSTKQCRSSNNAEKITEALLKLAKTSPITSITTNEIAHEAGVSVGNLYQKFGNRDSIAISILISFKKKQASVVSAILENAGDENKELQIKNYLKSMIDEQASAICALIPIAMVYRETLFDSSIQVLGEDIKEHCKKAVRLESLLW